MITEPVWLVPVLSKMPSL